MVCRAHFGQHGLDLLEVHLRPPDGSPDRVTLKAAA